jgi:tripartite ATP-independent transporter DctM subunit
LTAIAALLLVVLVLLGLPLFVGMLFAAMLGLYATGVDLAAIAIEIFRLANAPVLLAIPLFTFAGYLLSEGATSKRLVRFSQSLLGWLPGGLGIVALITCSFFTALTGATGITIIALGGLLFAALLSECYDKNFSLGLLTISGSLGIHFPPSLPIILYGFVSGVSIEELFLAALVPGVILVAFPCFFSLWEGRRWTLKSRTFSSSELIASLKGAAWELPIPFLIVAAIYTGFSTATETAAMTVCYVLTVKVMIYREIRPVKDMGRIMIESAKMVGSIMIILGAALGFTNFLVDSFIPEKILGFMENLVGNRIAFLLMLNLFLIIVGCLMDIFSAILVIVPLIIPLADRFGVDPLHLAIIFLTNLAIGYNTPPIGLNLFVASSRLERPVVKLYRASLPFLAILLIALILITYVPALTLFLPGLYKN